MVNRVLVWVIAAFFALGAVDYVLGGRLGLGGVFEKTLHKMGAVLLGVLGIYSLAPVAAQYVCAVVTPLADFLHVDPSVFPAMLFPIDMGGYQLAISSARDPLVGQVSAVLTSSICGATVGYTITVAVTILDKRHYPLLARGMLSGMVSVPVGCLAGALLCGVPFLTAVVNTLPLCVLAALLAWGLFKKPGMMTKLFVWLGRILTAFAVLGLTLQALQLLLKVTILPGMADVSEGLTLIGSIVFMMAGAMCLLEVLRRVLKKPLGWVARKLGVNDTAIAGMRAASVSATLAFTQADDMDARGLVVMCAFAATAAHVIGGQLGVVASLAPDLVVPFVLSKLIAGAAGIAVALLLTRREERAA